MPVADRFLPPGMSGNALDGQIDFDEPFWVCGVSGEGFMGSCFILGQSARPMVMFDLDHGLPAQPGRVLDGVELRL